MYVCLKYVLTVDFFRQEILLWWHRGRILSLRLLQVQTRIWNVWQGWLQGSLSADILGKLTQTFDNEGTEDTDIII